MTSSSSRPALLTLSGIYAGSKSVYSAYVPTMASEVLEQLAAKLIMVGTPIVVPLVATRVTKALPAPEPGAAADTAKEGQSCFSSPTDLASLDSLLVDFFSASDARIDGAIASSSAYVADTLSGARASVAGRVGLAREAATVRYAGAKAWAASKLDGAKPALEARVGAAKEAAKDLVAAQMEDEAVASLVSKATPYYAAARETAAAVSSNVEPARSLVAGAYEAARADIAEKGVVQVARESAAVVRDQGLASLETL